MKLVGANPNPKIVGMEELPGKSNYFIGNDPKKWRTNVPNYAKVKYANVYPGVDLVYYGNQGKLEYDFVVQPGADPRQIALDVGAGLVPAQGHPQGVPLRIDGHGDLVVGTDGGEAIFHKPVVYQPPTYNELRTTNGGGRDLVDGQYVLRGDNRIAFRLSDYDRRRPVVIDPALAYSTYLGGGDADAGLRIAIDVWGNAYVTGSTDSSDFPTTPGAIQSTYAGGSCPQARAPVVLPGLGCGDAFVSKLNSTGSALIYSSYLGGTGGDQGIGLAVDASGNAYVVGMTGSSDFPTTPGVFQTTYAGGSCPGGNCGDAFVSKLNPTGSALLYSTYLGGSSNDGCSSIAVDVSGNAYVTGWTTSEDFPTTPGAFQGVNSVRGLAFVSKLNAVGSALVYSTALGPGCCGTAGTGIAVDALGNAYVTGTTGTVGGFPTTAGAFQTTFGGFPNDAFVTEFNADGSALIYSTYLGGGGDDEGAGIALDASGNAYVTGFTNSSNFPTTPGAFQTSLATAFGKAFVTKLNAAGSAPLYSTYLGGSYAEDLDLGPLTNTVVGDIAVDGLGSAYVTGLTLSSDFPTTPGAFQSSFGGGSCLSRNPCADAFVSKLNAAGSALLYSTYLGGSRQDIGTGIAIDAPGNAYVTGFAKSSNFPTSPGAFQTTYGGVEDAFVTKFSFVGPGVVLAPSRLTFLVLRTVGTTSLPHAVKLTNTSGGELAITGITLTGPDPGDFAQSSDCPPTVALGASCLITITFTPTTQGVRTASVSITDSAAGSPQTVPLKGRGTFFEWSPRSVNLGDQKVGTSSAGVTVTLSNAGTAPITLYSIEMAGVNPGDFSQTNNCGNSLKAGASCTMQVTFTPTAVGSRLGHVAISDSAFGGTHWVDLLGKGT